MRIEVDIDTETRDRVREYADRNNVRLPRAYAELIEQGLDADTTKRDTQ